MDVVLHLFFESHTIIFSIFDTRYRSATSNNPDVHLPLYILYIIEIEQGGAGILSKAQLCERLSVMANGST